MSFAKELFDAVRPWSLTQTVVGMLLTASAVGAPIFTKELFLASVMAIFTQSGANLTNTYFDFIHGVDSAKYVNCNSILEKKLTPNGIMMYSIVCYGIGSIAIIPTLLSKSFQADTKNFYFFIGIFLIQQWLAYAYTGDPFRFKYRALGDVTAFLCFGPLVMSIACYIMIESLPNKVIHYTVLMGVLAEAILHMNNFRDIKNDKDAKIITFAMLIGEKASIYFFTALILLAYAIGLYVVLYEHVACALVVFTLPAIQKIFVQIQTKNLNKIVEKTAFFQLYFGIALVIGIHLTPTKGLLEMMA